MPTFPYLSQNRFKSIRKLHQKKFRKLTECYICEGYRLFEEAFSTPDITITELIIDDQLRMSNAGDQVIQQALSKEIPISLASSAVVKNLSKEVTPSGIIFIVQQRFQESNQMKAIDDDIILYLDRISEAGNLGSIMRSAAWFGVKTIALSPGCVDPRNAKSVRASAGGIFKLNIYTDINFNQLLSDFKKRHYQFIATVVAGGTSLNHWQTSSKNIIFFGHEASGISEIILKESDVRLSIPKIGTIESLNISTAVAIILYELNKQ